MNTDIALLEPHVRAILAEAPGNRVILSQMGLHLRKRIHGFAPEVYGAPNLKALLQRMPRIGRLVQSSALEWWFAAEEATGRSTETPDEREQQGDLPRIDRAWWNAITDFREDRGAWFDLANNRLSLDAELVRSEPERFIELPRFGLEAQREMARAWSKEQATEAGQECLNALDADRTLASFDGVVSGRGLRASWAERRSGAITTAALKWADDHGIDHHLFVRAHPQRREIFAIESATPTAAARAPEAFAGMTIIELRLLLHHAIEAMTEPELMQISVPARFLVRREPHGSR